MIDQGIAETNPQLGITWIAAGSVLQNSNGVSALSIARKRLRNAQPALGRGEVPEKCVSRVRKWEKVAFRNRSRR
jgi:hypothetical protein